MGGNKLIRLAEKKDLSLLLALTERFFNVSGYDSIARFDKNDVTNLLLSLIDSETILTDGKSAVLGFVVYPLYMNTDCLVSQELFWWVDEEYRSTGVGLKMLNEAEKISKQKGAKTIMMLSLNDLDGDKVNKLYERRGYEKKEQTYMRAL